MFMLLHCHYVIWLLRLMPGCPSDVELVEVHFNAFDALQHDTQCTVAHKKAGSSQNESVRHFITDLCGAGGAVGM